MNRRIFAAGLGLQWLSPKVSAKNGQQEIELDGTRLRFWHSDGRLHARFSAPTDGWVAVGFNNDRRLKETRFVIGALRNGRFHAEEHIAVVPTHPTVQSLGLEAGLSDVLGKVTSDQATMAFSLPHVFSDTPNPRLTPGTSSYLMLAWSHETDFEHHSAWRRHIAVVL